MEQVTFLYNGIFKQRVKGKMIIVDGSYTTSDPTIIAKLRASLLREQQPQIKKAKTKKKGGK